MKDHPFERRERYEFMIDYCSYVHSSCEIKAWTEKNSGLNWIRTHDICDTRTEHDQAIWGLNTLWVRNIPVEGKECKWTYQIWTVEKGFPRYKNLWSLALFCSYC